MWPDIVVIDLHSGYKLLRSDIAIKAPEYLRPLPEGSIQPFEDIVIRLRLEVLEPHVWVGDWFSCIIELVFDCIFIRLQPIGDNRIRPPVGGLLCLFQCLSCIGDKPLLSDLTGKEIPSLCP